MLKLRTLFITVVVIGCAYVTPALAVDAGLKKDAAVTAPSSQPATAATDEPVVPDQVPKDVGEAIDSGKKLVEQAKAKQWFAFSAGVIWFVMFLIKFGRKRLDFMKKIPKRALWIIVPVLSVAAMVLSKLQADLSWNAAVAVLFSGPAAAFVNDFIKRGLLGKEYSEKVNGG